MWLSPCGTAARVLDRSAAGDGCSSAVCTISCAVAVTTQCIDSRPKAGACGPGACSRLAEAPVGRSSPCSSTDAGCATGCWSAQSTVFCAPPGRDTEARASCSSCSAPPDVVDVNVHPAKAEVRFARSGAVFGLVERALRGVITAGHGEVPIRRIDGPAAGGQWVSDTPADYGAGSAPWAARTPGGGSLFQHPAYAPVEKNSDPVFAPEGQRLAQPMRAGRATGARAGVADTPFGRLIGQYRDSFILLEDEYGLVIVDQHVAHERVLYERILRQLEGEKAPAQGLLNPILVEVDEALAAALPRVEDLLASVGLEVDLFGPDTVRVTAHPPDLDAEAAGPARERDADPGHGPRRGARKGRRDAP